MVPHLTGGFPSQSFCLHLFCGQNTFLCWNQLSGFSASHIFNSLLDDSSNLQIKRDQVIKNKIVRYCMVLFAGIAAEALIYGEAEGGENDENLFRSISILLEPPLSMAQVFLWLKLFACLVTLYFYNAKTIQIFQQMSNQARWSLLQSYNLLKWHKHAHRAAVKAIENGCSLSMVIKKIEEAMSLKK